MGIIIKPNGGGTTDGANKDLDNLSVTGQAVIDGKANVDLMNTNFITNAILSAPNGVATYSGLQLQLPAGTILACPNGINADGTRKSIIVTTASLLTLTLTAVNDAPFILVYQTSGYIDIRRIDTTYYYEQPTTPTGMSNGALWYNNSPSVNKCYYYNGSTWVDNPFVVLADFSYTGGAISNFNPIYPIEIVKKTDSNWVGRQGKPSARFVDLTLGASGATYKAPANGKYYLNKLSGATGQSVAIINNDGSLIAESRSVATSGVPTRLSLDCKQGDTVQILYDLSGSTDNFRFIFDEGNFNV